MLNKLLSVVLLSALGAGYAPAQRSNPKPTAPKKYSVAGRKAQVYVTAAGTAQRLAAGPVLAFQPVTQPLETQVCVFLDPTKTYQTLLGIGGALTDASAETYAKLPKDQQQEFMRAYYSPTEGIGYSLARTNIASCDFSSAPYSYVAEGDKELKTFSVKHDEQFRIPMLKQATATAGGKLPLYVSPWSPPAWMKDNKALLQGGKLLPEYRQAWANHYVKFIKEYERQGLPIWGLSVQNEPMAKQRWESCIFTAEEERDYIKQYLGPTLKKNGLGNRKLIAWDHNRDQVFQRASTILDDPEAAQYVWGIGYHWYETWTGSDMLFDNLRRVHEAYPEKNLIFTEGCIEKFSFDRVGDWSLGEKYGYSMINDFNSGTVGWTDWNVLLDERGGPNHMGNFCFAPIIADTRTGKLVYTNIYYYIGHFSKFIRPGAKRIGSSSNRDFLSSTAFLNPDGKVAVVVMNNSDKAQDFQLWMQGQAVTAASQPHSIMTVVVN
ncbi:glycoside hydrolase family 30 protein [Hymenobacter sp. CRA2]|uniref:glycoside hydrolase family 30 protein n=1 Tax=Hymenobacter sp. CRA2 TaxID=1955620 RepID=UPI00098EB43C|nr:glycoside hydrolase family 30 protein [Hymenobacter sp. CRA2]OON70103.1 glycosyl hydrolase [Hymenobacter sp. CRA2]